ncbi:MAG: hypothetical protein JXX28_03880 [Deltaproteobacteria bacterium]|nr:hypothetical protein [Deltaproteobacteria bacterium]
MSATTPRDEAQISQLLRWLDRTALFVGLPVMLSFNAVAWLGTLPRGLTLMYGLTSALLLSPALLRRWLSVSQRAWLYAEALLAFSTAAIGIFGPFAGTGVLFSGAAILAALLLSRRGVLLVLAQTVVALLAMGIFHPGAFAFSAWLRILPTTLVILLPLSMFVHALRSHLEEARQTAVLALAREREERARREQMAVSLERSRHLEALGRLAGGVAHDVNNALSVIMGNAALLDGELRDPHQRELLGDLQGAAASTRAVVAELMLLGRGAQDEAGQAPVREALERLGRTLGRLLPEDHRLEIDGRTDASVPLSPAALERVLLNLVLNARDAMP